MNSNRTMEDALGTWRLSLYTVLFPTAVLGRGLSNPFPAAWCLGVITASPSMFSSHYYSFHPPKLVTWSLWVGDEEDCISVLGKGLGMVAGGLSLCTHHVISLGKARRQSSPNLCDSAMVHSAGNLAGTSSSSYFQIPSTS